MRATPVVPEVSAPDDEALVLIREAFPCARRGGAAELRALIEAGVPANVCNESGAGLLMLAARLPAP